MSGQAPPAVPVRKHGNRIELLRDVDYFLGEAVTRLERLAKIDRGHHRPMWHQAAALARRIRGLARHRLSQNRQRETRAARADRSAS